MQQWLSKQVDSSGRPWRGTTLWRGCVRPEREGLGERASERGEGESGEKEGVRRECVKRSGEKLELKRMGVRKEMEVRRRERGEHRRQKEIRRNGFGGIVRGPFILPHHISQKVCYISAPSYIFILMSVAAPQ